MPASRTVRIKAHRPGVKLTYDPEKSSVPDGVDVTLTPAAAEGGNPTWDLAVNVPANTLSGSLPPNSVIVLQIEGKPPRPVRIPLTGIATRK